MDEGEWRVASRPQPMLVCLRRLRFNPNDRRFKFFAYNCCRLAWSTLADERSRRAVETAEQYLVGIATKEQLAVATQQAIEACEEAYAIETDRPNETFSPETFSLSLGAAIAVRALVHGYTQNVVPKVRDALAFRGEINSERRMGSLLAEMSDSIRDIFGNPFRPVTLAPAWRTSTTTALAAQMYEYRDFSAMPILADALHDAGCENSDILDHCRGPGPHVRGCWVVDHVLGKS